MADYAILSQHPDHQALLIGISLDAFDRNTATDLAFHLTHSYSIPGIFDPCRPNSLYGDYLIFYKYNGTLRLATITASSRTEADRFVAYLQSHGRVVTPDQPIA